MRTSLAFATVATAGLLLSLVQGEAQEAAVPPPDAVSRPPADCTPKAALYQTTKGPRLWVLRQGSMVLAENPLRPMARDEALVLEVVVNGRRATAWGLDADNLRQGGTPKSVEREGREPIRWASGGAPPPALRVVAEDGRVLLGPMPFGGCEDAPAAKAVADAPEAGAKGRNPRATKRANKTAAEAPAGGGAHLPQGAIDGLNLQRGR